MCFFYQHSFSRFFFLIITLYLTTPPVVAASIPPFQAEYQLKHNGIEIGRVKLSLTQKDSHRYTLTSHTETSGLLSFVRDDDVIETSHFEINQGRPRPTTYQYQEHLGDGRKNVSLIFNWASLSVSNDSKGHIWHLDIEKGVVDKALMQIALMLDLNTSSNLSYKVADGGKLKTYNFSAQGTEIITLGDTSYQTIKLTRTKDDKPRITYYWCAKELHNLPILLQRKKAYGTFEMRLIDVAFNP